MNKPELLAPAGSYLKAKTAFKYGADAVYCGTAKLSLRTRTNMQEDDVTKIVEYAHNISKKVYVTLNIYARDEQYDDIIKQARVLNELKVDGVIVSDGGIIEIIKQEAPNIDIHISTQANVLSLHSANFWYKNGAKRIILARELNKEQIRYITENRPKELEIEMFAHGAICFGYSGRCFLSDFLTRRSANLGDCAQSCRWAYNIYIEDRNHLGELMPIDDDQNGTYIMSSKDLCLIKEIPDLFNLKVDSLKIEGRLKTEYYLATIINTYRCAIDDYAINPDNYDYTQYLSEIEKTKTRGLTTFYFNDKNNTDIQEYEGKQYNENYEFAGKVVGFEANKSIIEIKNKLQVGDKLEIIIPNNIKTVKFTIDKLWDIETDEEIDFVNPGRAEQKVKMLLPQEAKEGDIIRREK